MLTELYPWVKSLHLISVMSWMAGLFYLPRLFVYHAENDIVRTGQTRDLFLTMERKLFSIIMRPAMMASWVFGLILALTPGVLDFAQAWVWLKLIGILCMTGFHLFLGRCLMRFQTDGNSLSGRQYRLLNEVPTVLMVIIVVSVIVKF